MTAAVPTRETWLALAAAIPFLAAVALLGFALNTGALVRFAIAWPILQIAGYAITLRKSGGRFDDPLVRAQTMLHFLALALVFGLFARAL